MGSMMEEVDRPLFQLRKGMIGQPARLSSAPVDKATLELVLNEDSASSFLETQPKNAGIKKRGEVYTPLKLVEWILDQVGYTRSSGILDKYIVDPACGFGSFLRESVTRLKSALVSTGLNPASSKDAVEIMRAIETHVAGIELSSTTVRRSLVSYLEPVRDVIQTLVRSNPRYLPRPSIFQHNALSPALVNGVPFDFVVGNPPYVRHRDLPERVASSRTRAYDSATGRFDEYVLFFEIALRWLKVGGRVALVTPDRFLTSSYGEGLRRLLSTRTRIERIFRLPEDVFEGVGIYPIVTVAKRDSPGLDNIVEYVEAKWPRITDSMSRSPTATDKAVRVSQSQLGSRAWSFVPEWASSFVKRLRESLPSLESIATKIVAGVATGANAVFVIQGRAVELEPDRLAPALTAPDIRRGQIDWSGHYILNPYEIVEKEPQPIDLNKYPRTKKYLEQHKQLLELKYHVQHAKKNWFETHDMVDSRLIRKKKIVTPDIASSNRFAVDKGEFTCLNTCNMIFYDESIKTEALAAVLNSTLLEFMFKLSSPRLSRLHYRYMKRYLGSLPVPDIETMKKEGVTYLASCYLDRDWDSINEYVFELYEVPKTTSQRVTHSLVNGH